MVERKRDRERKREERKRDRERKYTCHHEF